jgi:hypothetical protein
VTKKFWKTSEFWISTLTTVGAVAGALVGFVPVAVGATVAGISGAAYAIARGLAKAGKP